MFKENLKMAWQAITSHKLRSLLSMLGIFIGVFSIIVILTMMDGFKFYVHEQFSNLGGSTVYINKFPFIITSREDFLEFRKRKPIEFKTFEQVKENSILADYVAPIYRSRRKLEQKGEAKRIICIASDDIHPLVDDIEVELGRFYTASEVKQRARVCVIGYDIVDQFFPGQTPIGNKIKIDGNNYRIIGITKRKGSVFGNSQDEVVYFPYTTLKGRNTLFRGLIVGVKTTDSKMLEPLKDELRGIVRKSRKVPALDKDNFAINEFGQLTAFFDQITSSVYMTVFAISVICLVVGGIGIANIMVVTVIERTKEIGIRKSLGARRKSILSQFLIESVTISVLGGLPAVLVGVIAAFVGLSLLEISMPLSLKPFIIGFTFSAFVGSVAGFFPALKASKLKPVEALSYG